MSENAYSGKARTPRAVTSKLPSPAGVQRRLNACARRQQSNDGNPRNVALLYLPKDMIGAFGNLVLNLRRRQDRQDALREIAFGLATKLAAHPWATRLFEQPELGPNMQLAAEHYVALLVAEGASPDEAFRWIRAVIAQVIGEILTLGC